MTETRWKYPGKGGGGMELRQLLALLLVLLLAAPVVEAKNRKGERLLKQGQAAELDKDYDKALAAYEAAVAADPADAEYILKMRKARFRAADAHLVSGQTLRKAGKLDEALAEFQKAFAIDPSSLVAEAEMRRTIEMIEREKRLAAEPGAQPRTDAERGLTPAQEAKKDTERRINEMMPAPELRPISRQITTLKMNNQPPKVLYDTVGKLAGINVIFDPDFSQGGTSRNFSVDLTNVTLEEALDYLGVLTKTFWKPLATNTIFVTQDQPQKRRDYEDFVVKTFYLNNVMTVQELSEIATAVRAVTDIRRLFQYNAQKAILVRGTVDQVNLAEKLIQDLDKPKGEVVVDVVVMEVSRSNDRTLGGSITSGTTNGLSVGVGPVTTTSTSGSSTTTTSSTVLLADLLNLGSKDFAVTLPGYALKAVMSSSLTKVVQSPQVRAVDNVKASLRIGDRVPTASGSYQSGIGSVGVSPLVNTQFQYIEVGVNVDMTPFIHSADEVSLHIELEISQVRDYVDIGGIKQPVIGQRKVAHDLRIKQGQVTVLGGIMKEENSDTKAGTPGLASIPLLKHLFSSNTHSTAKQELLIALVPHIVRAPEINAQNLKGVVAGNDQTVKLTYGTPVDRTVPAPAKPAGPATVAPIPGVPTLGAPAPQATVTPTPTPVPGTLPGMPPPQLNPSAPMAPPAAPPASTPAPPPPAGGPSVVFNVPSISVPVGGTTSVALQVQNVSDLFSAPISFKYDPKVVQIEEIQQGGMMSGGGSQKVIFTRNIQNDSGMATVNLNRLPGSGGTSGSGVLLTVVLKGVAPGNANLQPSAPLRNSQLQPISSASVSNLSVSVK